MHAFYNEMVFLGAWWRACVHGRHAPTSVRGCVRARARAHTSVRGGARVEDENTREKRGPRQGALGIFFVP